MTSLILDTVWYRGSYKSTCVWSGISSSFKTCFWSCGRWYARKIFRAQFLIIMVDFVAGTCIACVRTNVRPDDDARRATGTFELQRRVLHDSEVKM